MLAFERRDQILSHINTHKKVIIGEIALLFDVSEETIRRDLKKLEKDGLLTRFHGGATTNGHLINEEIPFQTRNLSRVHEKQHIARHLAQLIKPGQTLFVDSSSTATEGMFELLNQHITGLSIVTNSVSLLSDLRERDITVFSTGGELRGKSNSLVGGIAQASVKHYYGDVAVFGCKGLSLTAGVTESNEAEKQIKHHMADQVKKVILLADHSKFDQIAFVKLFELDRVDCVITDREPSPEWLALFEEKTIELIY